ncbi:MAG: hypothetical protein HLUCCA01_04075 [Bacteroidetes bacterium HLUCCA01]|nr:MAG: hypothetical protein HLUCCA01_04075 [Bacteroidetes bacterium HLUCCA01]
MLTLVQMGESTDNGSDYGRNERISKTPHTYLAGANVTDFRENKPAGEPFDSKRGLYLKYLL